MAEVCIPGTLGTEQELELSTRCRAEVSRKPLESSFEGQTSPHVWLNEGVIVGEQLTPGAPWRIRITDELRSQIVEDAPEGYVTVYQAMKTLGVSRQTVWQRVKRGELQAVHVRRGKRKGLRIKVVDQQQTLFNSV